MNIYYVYAYLRINGTPYYIGKGKNDRAYNTHVHHKPPKDKSRIIFLETNLTELGAFALERRYIRWYGRKDLGTGILRNQTNGGDGASGRIVSNTTRTKLSNANIGKIILESTKKKLAVLNIGKKNGPKTMEAKEKIAASKRGVPRSIQTKLKISSKLKGNLAPNKGIPHSKETRNKISIAKKGKSVNNKANHPFIGDKNPRAKSVMTPMGTFATVKEAARVLNSHRDTVINRIKSTSIQFADYYFI